MNIIYYQQEFLQYLKSKNWIHEPKNLYEPIDYILQLGGKRIRPVLTLMAADIFSSDYKKAMQENADLLLVISSINDMMAERGFPLKNME